MNDEQRYLTRGKFLETKFERECFAEYAQTFSTVCVDAGFYHFPGEKWIGGLCAQVPEHFRFGIKVTDENAVWQLQRHRSGAPCARLPKIHRC